MNYMSRAFIWWSIWVELLVDLKSLIKLAIINKIISKAINSYKAYQVVMLFYINDTGQLEHLGYY
jgi:hypothetical protein